jgi:hypothetical protein
VHDRWLLSWRPHAIFPPAVGDQLVDDLGEAVNAASGRHALGDAVRGTAVSVVVEHGTDGVAVGVGGLGPDATPDARPRDWR